MRGIVHKVKREKVIPPPIEAVVKKSENEKGSI